MSPDKDPSTQIPTSDMPPLGPTAEVPLRNQDNFNEKFQRLQESHNSGETAIVPPEHRDDRHIEQSEPNSSVDTATVPPEHLGGQYTKTGEEQNKPNWVKRVVAGIAGTAVLAVGGYVGTKALTSNEAPASTPDATTSAPTTPGETQAPAPEVKVGIGIEGTTFETANTAKAKEFVSEAKEPILEKDYTPEEAIVRFGQASNIYYLSGTIDGSAPTTQETSASQTEGEEILSNFFGSTKNVGAGTLEHRTLAAAGLQYLNEMGAAPTGKIGTYHMSLIPDKNPDGSYSQNPDGSYNVTERVETNFHDLDRSYFTDDETGAVSHEVKRIVYVLVKDGKYRFNDLVSDTQ